MKNPISSTIRGRILVFGIIFATLAVVFGPLGTAIGLSPEWQAVITSFTGAVGVLTNTLSRANLTLDVTSGTTTDATSTTETSAVEDVDVTAALATIDSEIQAEEAPVGDVDDPTGALTDSE